MAEGSLRDRLLAVAEELVATQGPHGVSLREIARRAGVSHGAPLRHFPTLANLLAQVSVAGFRRLDDALAAGAGPADRPSLSRLTGAARGYCRFGLDNPGLLTLMFHWELVDLSVPELATASHATFDRLIGLVADAQADGWHPGWETRRLAAAVWSAVHGLTTLWVTGAVQRPTAARTVEEILGPLLAILSDVPGESP